MKHWLLFAALLTYRLAAAQSGSATPPHAALPPLPESSPQPVMSSTAVTNAPSVRYQYRQVRLGDDRIWLAPAWRVATMQPLSRKLFNPNAAGELDELLLNTINELSADGWELLEIRALLQPTGAAQKLERRLLFSDPEQPVYEGTTTFSTSSETRYLFRKALLN